MPVFNVGARGFAAGMSSGHKKAPMGKSVSLSTLSGNNNGATGDKPMVAMARAALSAPPQGTGFANTATASAQQATKQRTATAAANGGFNTNRYAPNTEAIGRPTLMDDITPKDDGALLRLFDTIYQSDAVAGPAVDLISTIPWSDWSLGGIKDPGVMRVYEDAMENLNPIEIMPLLTKEYLMYGRCISSLLYDSSIGTWRGLIPHNPKYVTLLPTPIYGFDPLMDLTASPEMAAFIDSKDKRYELAKRSLPEQMAKDLKKGSHPLEPLNTLFVPRRVTMTDWKGTSMFMRILPYWAIEQALMASTIASARRRTRSILHLTVGRDGQWEPEAEDLDSVTTMFQATEEDPVGAIIATRDGIQANEIRSGSDFWKISEEADYLKGMKLNAFGLSETFLTGEASYTTMDATLSVFMESIKYLRAHFEFKVFENKVFDVIARANGFVKRKEADRAHGVRTSLASKTSLREGMKIPRKDLMMPTIHWTKNLSPESDSNYIEILKSLVEQGIPIPLKRWASAGGIDLADLENQLEEDKEIRERLKKYKPAPPPEAEGGDGGFGAFSMSLDSEAVMVLGSFADHSDHKNGNFFGVPYNTIRGLVRDLTATNRSMQILADNRALAGYLSTRLHGNQTSVDAAAYMLTRMGLARYPVREEFIGAMAQKLSIACQSIDKSDKNKLRALRHEVEILGAVHSLSQPKSKRKRNDPRELQSALAAAIRSNNNHLPGLSPYVGRV